MLDIANDSAPSAKCYFTHAMLGEHVSEKHPPTKKKPFNTILAQPFSHTADLILPDDVCESIRQELDGDAAKFHYARVYMSLGQIIDGDFFNHYIKTGNVLMISEGRRKFDNVFSLREGVLRLELDRVTYEQCGLVGKPIPHGGRKHTKERFAIELELRQPSMLHGKKGFERIVWAFKNVLNHSLTWLFHDVQSPHQSPSGPILAHSPQLLTAQPDCLKLPQVKVPALTSSADLCDPEYSTEVLEWLGMVSLESPRINASDDIDSFLSRYEVPMPYRSDGDADVPATEDLTRLRWRGLIPPAFLLRLWMTARRGVAGGSVGAQRAWMAMTVAGFEGETYTMLGIGSRDVLSWECK
ncbi:ribonuclease p 40kda subunit [Diplodia corticola]|uniref:Ribonuclease p 40kda subunit n=1 Tax=Diplodia corticola TaxID=236234 RepID=A0A1J9SD75_9PEZI|nr:ribonuclease p 40kda subunit [Diplodia corticola]OJD37804.1 ribonuclease p 40kda subunit [Diplodia corticola]